MVALTDDPKATAAGIERVGGRPYIVNISKEGLTTSYKGN